MLDHLLVELTPARMQAQAGGPPVDITVTIQNLGDVIDQYTVDVEGLEREWFTVHSGRSVGLFPGDREEVRVSLHPRAVRDGLQTGTYPFRVIVRSQGGLQTASADGILDVRGRPAYQVALKPPRKTARGRARFDVQLTNLGATDVQLLLEARDPEAACRFRFPKGESVLVTAGSKSVVGLPLLVSPAGRHWLGAERSHEFTVTARPRDAAGEPKEAAGQFISRSLLPSLTFPWRILRLLVAVMGLLVVVKLVTNANLLGGDISLWDQFQRGVGVAAAGARELPCHEDLLNFLCSGKRGPELAMKPLPFASCAYKDGFLAVRTANQTLVGDCTTNPADDAFGNVVQYATNGVLFWQGNGQNLYFLSQDGALYVSNDGKLQLQVPSRPAAAA